MYRPNIFKVEMVKDELLLHHEAVYRSIYAATETRQVSHLVAAYATSSGLSIKKRRSAPNPLHKSRIWARHAVFRNTVSGLEFCIREAFSRSLVEEIDNEVSECGDLARIDLTERSDRGGL